LPLPPVSVSPPAPPSKYSMPVIPVASIVSFPAVPYRNVGAEATTPGSDAIRIGSLPVAPTTTFTGALTDGDPGAVASVAVTVSGYTAPPLAPATPPGPAN